MLVNTSALLSCMTVEQRARSWFPLDAADRRDWDFVPKPDRAGLPLSAMDGHQRALAHTLLSSGLSMRGYTMALSIMAMENVLRETGAARFGVAAADMRNPDLYFFSFFGRPSHEETWGWRVVGHHLSLNYTIVDQRFLSVTPCNMGSQPLAAGVIAPLREDDRLGFRLLDALSPEQRTRAIIHDVAPADFVTRQVPLIGKVEYPDYWDLGIPSYVISDEDREALKFEKDNPRGVAVSQMKPEQADAFWSLASSHLNRMPEVVADKQLARLREEGAENIFFCWAGGTLPGTSHYYRIQSERLLFEFDNAIDDGNHIHSMWREYRNDFGHELLLEHYERERLTGHHLKTRLTSSDPELHARPTFVHD
ncbi:DUF3500 domain-containing protein [Actinospica sp. MGRD01-02]|uniref:DUF3500 domain-containing protein n=1 Tax=Actinospica acidithermotolerans TaxID=2828514 RepID=A0A941EAN9_9ACTN|nr:DUF3500 domain-containing protein [Actinospica acidithermotolerans]MBR7825579.1 DUF3500 domain-containing protein [Actinospica acidithermotolerans]